MRSPLRKPLLALPAVLAALALGACGNGHRRVTTGTYAGESGAQAPYLNVGRLTYEVQLSRELNPYNAEDASYLEGLSPTQRTLAPGEEWFAVFMQVYNNTGEAQPAASGPVIYDTQGNTYSPIVPAMANQFVYHAGTVPAHERLPELDTVASSGPTQGALLLYKLQIVSLDNRPLEIKIVDPTDDSQTATAELDV